MANTYISNRALDVTESATLAITAKVTELKKQGVDVVGFTAGQPDYPTPKHIREAAVAAMEAGHTKYTAGSGIPELKAAICTKFERDNGLSYTPQQIIVSNGAKHSIHNVLQAVVNPGDEVLVPIPSWVSYFDIVKLSRGTPVHVQTNENFEITAEYVAQKVTDKTKLLMLNSPSNPTGAMISEEELRKIGELAVEKDFLILSDEIYEHMVYDGKHVSIASLSDAIKERTLVINGVSKAYAMTGWRIGYCAGPLDIIKAMGRIQSQATSCPNSIAQHAALAALNGPQESVEEMRQEFAKRREVMVKRLNEIPGVSCKKPKGAFYVFADISGVMQDSMEFAKELLEKVHVAVVPGKPFEMDGHVRLSFATSLEEIVRGLDRIETFCKERVK